MNATWWCVASDAPWSWQWRPYAGAWAIAVALLGLRAAWEWRSGPGQARGALAWFLLAVVSVWAATDWPVAALGAGYLLSIHTLQYLVLGLIAPALLLLGVPGEVWNRCLVTSRGRALLTGLARPGVGLLGFTVILVITHVPALLDWMMTSPGGSFAVDMSWLAAGLLLWLPVLAASPLALPVNARVGYLAAAAVPHAIPAAFLLFSDYPLYRVFELAPRIAGIDAATDQQIAGAVMNFGSMLVLLAAFSVAFFRMAREA